jgi:hypothetical protein
MRSPEFCGRVFSQWMHKILNCSADAAAARGGVKLSISQILAKWL